VSEVTQILLVEDSAIDAALTQREIEKILPNCRILCIEEYDEYIAALKEFQPDLIISDYAMSTFDGLAVIQMAKKARSIASIIILTGSIDEDTAVACMKAGADDYVLKEHLRQIGPAIIRALAEKRLRQERQEAQEALIESQERLNMALAAALMGVWEWNLESETIIWSPECRAIMGWTAQQEPLPNFIDTVHPEDRDQVMESVNKAISSGDLYEAEFRIFHPSGEIRWISGVGQAKYNETRDYNEKRDALRVVGTIQDITARKQAALEQEKLEAQLRQSQKLESIGRLAGGIAHDFNNLLTVMAGYTHIAQSRLESDAPLQKTLSHIQRANERAAKLTHQLLAFSRKQMLAPSALDVNALTKNLHHMLDRLISENITLTIKLQPSLWAITADASQLEQVIINLVVNARDAMPTGGCIAIETNNVEINGEYLSRHRQLDVPLGPAIILTISDTGHGMTDAVKAQIFEPFFTTKEAGKGTGLGLATVYGIIKQSGGDIIVQSAPGKGSTFQIIFPATLTKTMVPDAPIAQPLAAGGNETILLLEDEEMVRRLAGTVLREQGYKVLEVTEFKEIFPLVEQHHEQIDLLLTDVVMPEFSGPQLAAQIKKYRPGIRVLFMSGYTDDTVVHHGLQTAQVEFIPKPFSPASLVEKVRTVLDKQVSTRQ